MFEYTFTGPGFTVTKTTTDFLQFCIDVAVQWDAKVLGAFLTDLFEYLERDVMTLPVIDWNFTANWGESTDFEAVAEMFIDLRKVK